MRCAPICVPSASLLLLSPWSVELREWTRMTDDLNGQRNRLCNRF